MLKVNIISDVHYQLEGLARSSAGADLFICLGDLVLFLDYDDATNGIFADLFGRANTEQYLQLRAAKQFEDARAFGIGQCTAVQPGRGRYDSRRRCWYRRPEAIGGCRTGQRSRLRSH